MYSHQRDYRCLGKQYGKSNPTCPGKTCIYLDKTDDDEAYESTKSDMLSSVPEGWRKEWKDRREPCGTGGACSPRQPARNMIRSFARQHGVKNVRKEMIDVCVMLCREYFFTFERAQCLSIRAFLSYSSPQNEEI
jgi:hypothetical protein